MSKRSLPPFRNLDDLTNYCITLGCDDTILIDTGIDINDIEDEKDHSTMNIVWARFRYNDD